MALSLAAGFTAGFVGSIASQSVANALGLQEGVNVKGALISGLATAATAGLLKGLNDSAAYQEIVKAMENLSVSKAFSISSAAKLMEAKYRKPRHQPRPKKHQHFDWEQLAVAGATAGIMGGTMGRKLDQTLRTVDHNTGILTSQLRALTTAGAEAAATGSHFGAVQVLSDNLGNAIGSSIVDKDKSAELKL